MTTENGDSSVKRVAVWIPVVIAILGVGVAYAGLAYKTDDHEKRITVLESSIGTKFDTILQEIRRRPR